MKYVANLQGSTQMENALEANSFSKIYNEMKAIAKENPTGMAAYFWISDETGTKRWFRIFRNSNKCKELKEW